MTEQDIKTKIKHVAINSFNKDGFYGASIRDIAKEANCSLPTIYYYYKNKKELFDEIIKKDFFELLSNRAIKLKSIDAVNFYVDFVYGLKDLAEYDKKVYRLAVKVYLSFDGDGELQKIMGDWEQTIFQRHREIIRSHFNLVLADSQIRALVHLLENIIERIVVKNENPSRNEIREEIETVLVRNTL